MKISSLPSALLLFLLAAVPAALHAAPAPETSRIEVFDFFDFRAMSASPSGELLRDHIFSDLKRSEPTAGLFAAVNAECGTAVPESVARATVAVFSDPVSGRVDAAKFEFLGDDAEKFAALEARSENSRWQAPAVFGLGAGTLSAVPFPRTLAEKLPAPFAQDAKTVFFHADREKKTCTLIALRAEPDAAAALADARTAERTAELLRRADENGLLIFRKFPRRAHEPAEDGEYSPAVPAGEFSISERDGRTVVLIEFFCSGAGETAFFERFFRMFRDKLLAGTNVRDEEARNVLAEIGRAFSVSSENDVLRIRIDCGAENFPEFLKRREIWCPRRPGDAEKK